MKRSIRTKILSGYLVVVGLFISVVISDIFRMSRVSARLSVVEQVYQPMLARVNTVASFYYLSDDFDGSKVVENFRSPLFSNSLRITYPRLIRSNLYEMRKMLEAAADSVGQNSEWSNRFESIEVALHRVEQAEEQYQTSILRTLRAATDSNRDSQEEKAEVHPEFSQQSERMNQDKLRMRSAVQALSIRLNSTLRKELARINLEQKQASVLIVVFSALAILLTFFTTYRSFVALEPIRQLIQGAKRISKGEYEHRVRVESEDEVGILANEFNAMAESVLQRNSQLESLSNYHVNIIQNIKSALIVTNLAGEVTSANQFASKLCCESGASLIGNRLEQIPLFTEIPAFIEGASGVRETSEARRFIEVEVKQSGKSSIYHVSHLPLLKTDQKLEGVITLIDDVTEELQAKRKLLHAERLAIIGRMSAQVTHEIRNPLNSIGLNLEMLRDELKCEKNDPTESVELICAIEKEIGRLNAVAEGYLNYSRPSGREQELVVVNELIEEITFLLREEARRKGITLDTNLFAELPDVTIDRDQMKQALLNLMRNGIESMHEKPGTLRISTRRNAQNAVVIEVQDEGSGVSKEELEHIFEPFFTTKGQGTGLGLALTQRILDEQGASIRCESREGYGTCFKVELPVSNV